MTKDNKPVEVTEAEMDEVNGGWIIIDSMSAPVRAENAPGHGASPYIADDGATQVRTRTPA